MIISHKHRFVFVAIPKTGTTSVEKALSCFNEEGMPKHAYLRDATPVLREDNLRKYFKFSFIRNPWDRMVSVYFQLRKPIGLDNAERQFLFDLSRQHSFKDFLKKIREIDPHFWRNKNAVDALLDSDGKCGVNYLGKFENLRQDFESVCERIKIKKRELSHENFFEKKHYSHYYDDEARRIVEDAFVRDIRCGDYTFETRGA